MGVRSIPSHWRRERGSTGYTHKGGLPPCQAHCLASCPTHHNSDVLGQVLGTAHQEVREGCLWETRYHHLVTGTFPCCCSKVWWPGRHGPWRLRWWQTPTHPGIEHLVPEAAVEFLRVGLCMKIEAGTVKRALPRLGCSRKLGPSLDPPCPGCQPRDS